MAVQSLYNFLDKCDGTARLTINGKAVAGATVTIGYDNESDIYYVTDVDIHTETSDTA